MPNKDFYATNDHALKPIGVDVRDAIPTLAVQLLIARNPDFATSSPDNLIQELTDIVKSLHSAFEYVRP